MKITSNAFTDNGIIPDKHTGFGEDISPDFTITDAPEKTESFAIILDDLDVPFVKIFNHWLIWNIPKVSVIPEGLPKGAVISEPVNACQGAAWGKHCYRGPKQPFFIINEHRYVFTVYALDCQLDISEKSKRKNLLDAMNGHILAEAKLTGKHRRSYNKNDC